MKNTIKSVIAFTLIAAAQVALAAPARAPLTTITLDNGLKVIIQEDHSTDLVAVDVWVGAGTINETAETNGVAHFIEHLLFKGTDKRGPGQVDIEIESLGASLDAKTGRDWAHFYTVVARRYLDKSLDVLSDVVMNPKFREEDIDRERLIILDEIARRDNDPYLALNDALFAAAYTAHPYRLPVEGTYESISNITREMIVDHYNRLYVPENTTVILVGDITAEDGQAAVSKAFAAFKRQPANAPKPADEPARTQPTRRTINRNTKLSYLGIAFLAPSVKDRPDVFAMDVLVAYLGMGYQSWLSAEIMDSQRLAFDAYGDFLTQRDPGIVVFQLSTQPAKVKEAEDAIMSKLKELGTTKISDADLARAKRWLEGNHAFDTETFSGRATNLGFYTTINCPEVSVNYVKEIRKITAEDVMSAAKKYLDPERAVVVVMGP